MKENFNSTLQMIPEGVIVLDLKDCEVCYANQETYKLLGILNTN